MPIANRPLFAKPFGLRAALALVVVGAGIGGLAHRSYATAQFTEMDRLVAQDQIRQKLALYGILADGDGVNPKNIRALVDEVMTADVSTDLYFPGGALQAHSNGREEIVATTPLPKTASPLANRHYLIATYFDAVGPTSAKTRTTMMWMQVTKNMLGADCAKGGADACGGRVVSAMTTVYHNDWVKTSEGWRMSRNVIRRDD